MNRADAQKILALVRPETADEQDADFKDALALAASDAELKQWFETHCANYKNVRDALRQIAPLPALREQILSERNLSTSPPNVVVVPRSQWRSLGMGMAAAAVLLLGIAFVWLRHDANKADAQFRNRMVSAAFRIYRMDLETNDQKQVQTFLAKNDAPSDYALPEGLRKSPLVGCEILRWQNRPVTMICFRTGRVLRPGEKSDLFLFVADATAFPKNRRDETLNFQAINQVMTASWSEGGKFYLLATRGDENFLRKFL